MDFQHAKSRRLIDSRLNEAGCNGRYYDISLNNGLCYNSDVTYKHPRIDCLIISKRWAQTTTLDTLGTSKIWLLMNIQVVE